MLAPSQAPVEAERRGTPRYQVDLAVCFWRGDAAGPPPADVARGKVRDVSWGGMFVDTPERVEPGTAVTLLVSMPQHRDPVPLVGAVAWVASPPGRAAGLGIKLRVAL